MVRRYTYFKNYFCFLEFNACAMRSVLIFVLRCTHYNMNALKMNFIVISIKKKNVVVYLKKKKSFNRFYTSYDVRIVKIKNTYYALNNNWYSCYSY